MTIEQMLEKLENDKSEAEHVRDEIYLKTADTLSELRDGFYWLGILDEGTKQKYDNLVCQEAMSCLNINAINTAIDEIKKRL